MSVLVKPATIALLLLLCVCGVGRAQDQKTPPDCDTPTDTKKEGKDDQKDKCKDIAELIYRQTLKERMEKEKGPSKSRFFNKIHVDGLWVPGQTDAKFLGVVGTHVTVIEMGRVHLFGPPGVMVLRADGKIRTALTWGFSLYMTQFRIPGTTRELALFGDFARAWTFGDYRTGMDLVGMSVAWRR
jgi:hypothetical protein